MGPWLIASALGGCLTGAAFGNEADLSSLSEHKPFTPHLHLYNSLFGTRLKIIPQACHMYDLVPSRIDALIKLTMNLT